MYEQIAHEIATLTILPRNKYRESIDAAISALQAIEKRDVVAAESLSKQAEAAWPENEMIHGISRSIEEIPRAAVVPPVPRTAEPEQVWPLLLIKNYPRSICVGCAAFCFLLAAVILLRRAQRSRRRYIG